MVVMRGVGTFHLWPVTKFQFEQFMSENNRYGDEWYEKILSLNKRISYRNFSGIDYERLFITGVLPHEAIAFARWLGKGFDLPTEAEWKKFYKAISNVVFDSHSQPSALSTPAVTLWKRRAGFLQTPLEFSCLQGGVVEWVKGENRYAGRGAPRYSFFPNAWNPPDDSIRVIDKKERIIYFGFRLIKRD